MALFDPVEAIFESMGSLFARVLLGAVALVLAFLCYALSVPGFRPEMITLVPLVTIGVFVKWASSGLWFFVGLAAGMAYLVTIWKFLQTVLPRQVFLGLFLLAAVYYVPMTWGEKFADKDAFGNVCIFVAGYVVLAFILPQLEERRAEKKRARRKARESAEESEDSNEAQP